MGTRRSPGPLALVGAKIERKQHRSGRTHADLLENLLDLVKSKQECAVNIETLSLECLLGYATTTVTKTADWRMPTSLTGLRKQRQHVNLSSASSPADGCYEKTSGQGRLANTRARFCRFLITPVSPSSFSCC